MGSDCHLEKKNLAAMVQRTTDYRHDLLHLNQAGYGALNQSLVVLLQESKFED